jgi:hypothetical protein
MDCREFRDNHASFLDQRCSAVEEHEMRQHAQSCASCAKHDTSIRRSLLLVRNLPTVDVSPGFQARLNARLRGVTPPSVAATRPVASLRSFAALAAGIVFVAYLAAEVVARGDSEPIELAPVVATLPDVGNSQLATPALAATAQTGMSVWPALMVASQSVHFVAAELATER